MKNGTARRYAFTPPCLRITHFATIAKKSGNQITSVVPGATPMTYPAGCNGHHTKRERRNMMPKFAAKARHKTEVANQSVGFGLTNHDERKL